MPQELHFKISTGLKRIIGRDLITNDFVAIFELVKNSFDAHATRVDLVFEENSLYVIDNGKGMSFDDITNKWLFVAYSAKKDGIEEDQNYRDKINNRRVYAGSKGVGRFSCDRVGNYLAMQTKQANSNQVEILNVNWDLFEEDDKENFHIIPVNHETRETFLLPEGIKKRKKNKGTILEIKNLRENWDRKKILSLKSALAKLINPFGQKTDSFEIYINAQTEILADIKTFDDNEGEEDNSYQIVNGKIENFIFDTLTSKTTFLEVSLNKNGSEIETKLKDRGELIYHITEPNNAYSRLKGSSFQCRLFYLNFAAKNMFTRRMGVQSVGFGSVFLFRNGFRVFPVGEPGDDTLGLDRRKAQGYARYLGTRELIGRIDVKGKDIDFAEATSRDQGLIRTAAYEELENFFIKKCLTRLEKYVVDINWADPLDKEMEDISRLEGDKPRSRIIKLVSNLAGSKDVELIEYSKNLIGILNEKSEDFEDSLRKLKNVAESTGDKKLTDEIKKAEIRYKELKALEEKARAEAEEERKAREVAEEKAKKEEAAHKKTTAAYEEEKKRNLFLASVTTLDHDNIINLHHQIGIYSANIHSTIANQIDKLNHNEKITTDDLTSLLERLSLDNQKILAISRFATKANFRLDSEEIEVDISSFIKEYVVNICKMYTGDKIDITIDDDGNGLIKRFKPIEIAIIIDNLVNNSKKAKALKLNFEITNSSDKEIRITITDNGNGFTNIKEIDRVFEKGFSTTDGSGLGLYHIAYMLDQMGGGIVVNKEHNKKGAQFVMRIPK